MAETDRPERRTKTLSNGDVVHETGDRRFISSPSRTVHERDPSDHDEYDFEYHPRCGTRLPEGSLWGGVDADSPAEAVVKFDLGPCTQCFDRAGHLRQLRRKARRMRNSIDDRDPVAVLVDDGAPEIRTDGGTIPLHHGEFVRCDECGDIVILNGHGECLELDDAVYCPRHARPHMPDGDWELRWGEAINLLDAIRDDHGQAIKYQLPATPGSFWVVHREGHIYEQWRRCDDDEASNYTTVSESSLVRDIERRAIVGGYHHQRPHLVAVADAPINAGQRRRTAELCTDGGQETVSTSGTYAQESKRRIAVEQLGGPRATQLYYDADRDEPVVLRQKDGWNDPERDYLTRTWTVETPRDYVADSGEDIEVITQNTKQQRLALDRYRTLPDETVDRIIDTAVEKNREWMRVNCPHIPYDGEGGVNVYVDGDCLTSKVVESPSRVLVKDDTWEPTVAVRVQYGTDDTDEKFLEVETDGETIPYTRADDDPSLETGVRFEPENDQDGPHVELRLDTDCEDHHETVYDIPAAVREGGER